MPKTKSKKRADKIKQNIKMGVWVVAAIIAVYVVFSFVRGYMGVGAAAFVLPTGINSVVKSSKPTDTVCESCQQSGILAPPCKGTCPEGQDCKLVIDTGLCTCV